MGQLKRGASAGQARWSPRFSVFGTGKPKGWTPTSLHRVTRHMPVKIAPENQRDLLRRRFFLLERGIVLHDHVFAFRRSGQFFGVLGRLELARLEFAGASANV